jgi:hypothetical protein
MLETVELSKDELSQISMALACRMAWLLARYAETLDSYYDRQYEQAATAHDKISAAVCR